MGFQKQRPLLSTDIVFILIYVVCRFKIQEEWFRSYATDALYKNKKKPAFFKLSYKDKPNLWLWLFDFPPNHRSFWCEFLHISFGDKPLHVCSCCFFFFLSLSGEQEINTKSENLLKPLLSTDVVPRKFS